MKPSSYFRKALLQTAISFSMLPAFSQAGEILLDAPTVNVNVGAGDSVWFDSANTNAAIAVQTINGTVPATGSLPGWVHTLYGFVKYDGTQMSEMPNGEKVVGQVNLGLSTVNSVYFDNFAETTYVTNQSMGSVETTRDFIISNGATLNVSLGGVLFHNNSHWMKNGDGGGSATSSSGTLAVISNGGGGDYQINGVVIKDFNGTTPLKLIKSGPDPMRFNATNTYTGGTWINNGRLSSSNASAFGTGTIRVSGTNSQLDIGVGGTYVNALVIEGNGWAEGTEQRGALRFEANATMAGNLSLTGASRIVANGGATGKLAGTLTGSANLEVGLPVAAAGLDGTVTLTGSGSAYTGTINVSRGRFNAYNLLGGSVHVSDAGTFSGTSTIAGSLGVGDTTGSTVVLDPALPLQVNGGVSFVGASKIALALMPGTSGTFPLLNYTGALTGVANVSLDQANYRPTVTLNTGTPGSISVTVSGAGLPLVWTGAGATADWNVNGVENWVNAATPSKFLQGDAVTFNDTATVTTLNLLGALQPSAIVFNNTDKEYTLNGFNNGIVGTTGVTKNGTGLVSLGGQNSTFTGPVAVNAGILKLLNAEAFGFTPGITVAAGAQVDLGGHSPGGGGVPVPRHYTWTIAGNGPDGLGALNNSGGAIYEGAGIRNLILTGDASINTNTGRMDIGYSGGTVGQITGNNHTLTLNAGNGIGVRGDASGSPIHYVVASGRAWGENSDNVFGGANGTLVVKSGARAGSYGIRTFATPVTLESGGSLYVEGGGTGTWTGTVSVSGEAILDAGNQELKITGAVSGTAAVTKTGGNTVTLTNPAYVGNTTVSAGTLSLGAATLQDSSTVTLADAAKLTLTHGSSDAVASLVINNIPMAAGVYGAPGSGAAIIDGTHFGGTGRLVVGGGGGAYGTWAALHGVGLPEADDDNDGIKNGIEFIIGGDPKSPGDHGLLPISQMTATHLVFTFRRTAESASAAPVVQYGSDLSTWATAENGTGGVTIAVDNLASPPTVTVTIPRPASPTTKLFARLKLPL